jgi:hypothetical protein
MCHNLICCKVAFELHINIKLHILNINQCKLIFHNLKIYIVKLKLNIYMIYFFVHHT